MFHWFFFSIVSLKLSAASTAMRVMPFFPLVNKRGYELLVKWWIVIVYVALILWCIFIGCCICGVVRIFFYRIDTFMRKFNVLWNDIYSNRLHWKYEFSRLRLINDYVWIFVWLNVWLFVRLCMCLGWADVSMHLWWCTCTMCTFSAVYSISFASTVYSYSPQLVILISDVDIFFLFFFSFFQLHRIENKSNGIQ